MASSHIPFVSEAPATLAPSSNGLVSDCHHGRKPDVLLVLRVRLIGVGCGAGKSYRRPRNAVQPTAFLNELGETGVRCSPTENCQSRLMRAVRRGPMAHADQAAAGCGRDLELLEQ